MPGMTRVGSPRINRVLQNQQRSTKFLGSSGIVI